MSRLRQAAVDYLALRRGLGFKLRGHDRLLADFLDHLERTGTTALTVSGPSPGRPRPPCPRCAGRNG